MEVHFEYPATILSIEGNSVTVMVSVMGKDKILVRDIDSFDFQIEDEMDLIAQGVEENGKKFIRFKIPERKELTDEMKEIIKRI